MGLRIFAYRPGEVKEVSRAEYPLSEGYNKWVSVIQPEQDELEWIFSTFSLHPLVVEDILSKNDPPKADEYAGYTFIITDAAAIEEERATIHKIFLILGKDFLVSITDLWDVVRDLETRLINRSNTIGDTGPDYLAYSFIDRATDSFYPVMDGIEDVIEDVEEEVIESIDSEVLVRMSEARRDLLTLWKSACRRSRCR